MSKTSRLLMRAVLGGALFSFLLVGCGGSSGSGNSNPPPPPGNNPPTIAFNAPTTGIAALRGDTVSVTFTANDDGNGLVRLIASVDANVATTGDNTQVFGPEADTNGAPATRTFPLTGLVAGVYTLFATIDDGVNPVVSATMAGSLVVIQGHAGVAPPRSTAFGVRNSRVLISVGETEDALVPLSLNGDVDAGDGVLATIDTATAGFTQHNLSTDVTGINGQGTARKLDNDGGFLFFQMREADQGFVNADIDNTDTLFGWWDTAAVQFHNYGGVFSTGRAVGLKALVAINEAEEGGAPSLNPPDADVVDTIGGTIDLSVVGGFKFVIPRAAINNPRLALDGSFAAFHISEANQGLDMSVPADGDMTDNFLLVANATAGTFLGLAGTTGVNGGRDTQPGAAFDVSSSSRVVYYANEVTNGVDFNGDGDMNDNVPSLWNPTGMTPVATFPGAGLQAGPNPPVAAFLGTRLFYTSAEARNLGPADDNGDTDLMDVQILRWTDQATPGTSTVLAPNLTGFPALTGLSLDGGFLAEVGTNFLSVVVQEGQNGNVDLSGDGNIGPALLIIDTSTPVPTVFNTSLSPMASPAPGLIPITGVKGASGVAVLVSEIVNGNLNGDMDATDTLLFFVPFGTPTVPVNLGSSAAVDVHIAGSRIGIIANEQTNLTDYDGDGDNFDMVFRAFTTTGLLEQAGLKVSSTSRVAADDGTLWAFLRSEVAEVRDLNNDGDQLDVVVGFWKP
jgi:hypothetical protein